MPGDDKKRRVIRPQIDRFQQEVYSSWVNTESRTADVRNDSQFREQSRRKRGKAALSPVTDRAAWETLRRVIEDISGELSLQPLLTRIVIHACDLIGADNGTIGLYDPARDLIRTEAVYRMPPDELGSEMPRGIGLGGEVLRTKMPVVLEYYGDVANPTQPDLVENAVVGVPILWREEIIGVFGIGGSPQGKTHFDTQDVEMLSLFARHAAIAIVNARRYESEQQARRETQLLFDTSARMSMAENTIQVVTAYLEQVASGGQFACSVTEYEWENRTEGDPSWIRIIGVWHPERGIDLLEKRHPYVRDLLDNYLDAGETIAIRDVHSDPRVNPILRQIQEESGRPALALIPLRGQALSRIGHVILSAPRVHEWTEEELRRFEITAAQLATALEIRRQRQLGSHRQQQLAVLEERRRLARDLHDAVTQMLFSLHLIAQSVPPILQRKPEEAARRTERVVELSHAALTEMRALLSELKPADDSVEDAPDPMRATSTRLRRDGLEATMTGHVTQVNDAQAALPGRRARVSLESGLYHPILDASQEEALLRIAQESIANAVKHAQARRIQVRLATLGTVVTLTIYDDGCGFTPKTTEVTDEKETSLAKGGMGLTTMRERAEAQGGVFSLVSQPGNGTTVTVTLPGRK